MLLVKKIWKTSKIHFINMTKNRLYVLIFTACLLGFLYSFYKIQSHHDEDFSVCLIKNTTGIPCPSCGTTRAIIAIFRGNFIESTYINPLGILVLSIMIVAPFWIMIDWILKKSSFYFIYKKVETRLKNPIVYIPLLILVIANWVWNILKNN